MASCLCAPAILALAASQSLAQTGPVTEPRGAAHEPAGPPVAKGAAAITQQHDKCLTRLIVSADALFQPDRWTLNHDAGQTLDALGPQIAHAGKHPARIVAYTASSKSQSENRDVSQRRALTVRTWLVNHRYVPENTPAEVSNEDDHVAEMDRGAAAHDAAPHRNGTVDVVMDSCH